MDAIDVAAALKDRALELGFDLFGVTDAGDFLDDLEAFSGRLSEGLLEGMPWLNLERAELASRPRELLPEARSVIVLGMSYLHEEGEAVEQGEGPAGLVAKYAHGRDYHNVIRPKLRGLTRYLEELVDRPVLARLFVDSGPFVERAAARRSGIGWVGKNTLVLNREFGSWTFLAAIICDVDLPAGEALATNCGTCRRCIDICPTNALPAPFVLDATRCISYLTIEHRGAIDPELRPLMSDLVFGCDLCQEVCPVNRKALFGKLNDLRDTGGAGGRLPLVPLLALTEGEFAERFRGSPLKRAKRAGLARNAAIALGNAGDASTVDALSIAMKEDADVAVRGAAAWALGRIGGEGALQVLISTIEDDAEVRAEIAGALAAIGDRTN